MVYLINKKNGLYGEYKDEKEAKAISERYPNTFTITATKPKDKKRAKVVIDNEAKAIAEATKPKDK